MIHEYNTIYNGISTVIYFPCKKIIFFRESFLSVWVWIKWAIHPSLTLDHRHSFTLLNGNPDCLTSFTNSFPNKVWFIVSENLLPWQPYNAFSYTPKNESFCAVERTVRWNLLNSYITCYQEWSSKYASFKKSRRVDDSKNLLFVYWFFNFFPPTECFKNWHIYASNWS